jgi:cobyrinic acid a,c-diamide synthase
VTLQLSIIEWSQKGAIPFHDARSKQMNTKAVVIAGSNSGCGKTTVSLGLMAAFKKRGLAVQGFKVGPDYIDPSLHRIITDSPSINLDTWMMPENFLCHAFSSRAKRADISIIEGVMGLYDGKSPTSDDGSTAELAVKLNLPVILVINAKSMARTAAAIVKGLIDFNPELNIIGVVFNQVSSARHLEILTDAVNKYCGVNVLGGLNSIAFTIPSRHLGLYMGEDNILQPDHINYLADQITKNIDLNTLLSLSTITCQTYDFNMPENQKTDKRLAIAKDKAFCFYYQDNIDILNALGYEIIEFSPMNDKKLPENIDVYYFGGGYPELYAQSLSDNLEMLKSIYHKSNEGKIIYAECGGLMYLGKSITTTSHHKYSMAGCFDYETYMMNSFQSLGYVEIQPKTNFFILNKDKKLRGHSFHYSKIKFKNDSDNFYSGTPISKALGYRKKNTLASYVHLHFSHLFQRDKS